MQNITTFEPDARYIVLPIFVWNDQGKQHKFKAILDTGAPRTEFSDEALHYAGFEIKQKEDVKIIEGLQTSKYADIVIPKLEICSHLIRELDVYVSRFEKSWGIDALIGLDFFRRFRTTIDYEKGGIIAEPIVGHDIS